ARARLAKARAAPRAAESARARFRPLAAPLGGAGCRAGAPPPRGAVGRFRSPSRAHFRRRPPRHSLGRPRSSCLDDVALRAAAQRRERPKRWRIKRRARNVAAAGASIHRGTTMAIFVLFEKPDAMFDYDVLAMRGVEHVSKPFAFELDLRLLHPSTVPSA